MENLPLYISLTFDATVLLTVWLFLKASHYPILLLCLIVAWVALQITLGVNGFYNDINTTSLRFPLLVGPPLVLIILTFLTKRGRTFIDGLDIRALTIIHIIRIPVEIVLFWLMLGKVIPAAMTFEGRNFDILSGLSSPVIYYFGFIKQTLEKTVMIAWNVVCVALLLNVVSGAVLSLPGRFERFGFEVPNIAVGYFPFLLLPAVLVPMVLFANLASVRLLLNANSK